jgi:putative intracellular protease/amidase
MRLNPFAVSLVLMLAAILAWSGLNGAYIASADGLVAAGDKAAPKVLLLIRDQGSQQLEYMLVNEVGPMRKILAESGFDVTIASVSGKAIKTDSITVVPDCELSRVKIDDYAGFILPCMVNDSAPAEVVTFVKEVAAKGKPIAAQVAAVCVLGKAGVLSGRKFAFANENNINVGMYPALESGILSGKGVVQDGAVVTSGTCPMMSKMYGYPDGTAELTRTLIAVMRTSPQNIPYGTNDVAQGNPGDMTAEQRKAIEKAVLEVHDKIIEAEKSLDAEKFFAYVPDFDSGLIIQDGTLFKTRLEAMETIRVGFQSVTKVERTCDQTYVTVLSPETALLTATGTSSVTLPDGRTLSGPFAASMIFVLRDGQWKLLQGHYSTPNPR